MKFFLIIFSFLSSISMAATHAPTGKDGEFTFSPSLRFIGQNSVHTFLADYENLNLSNKQEVNSIGLTYRYRLASHSKNWCKTATKKGLLHDNDWIKETTKWVWQRLMIEMSTSLVSNTSSGL